MHTSSSLQKSVFFVLFGSSVIKCRTLFKRALESPATVLGDVYHFVGDEAKNTYETDHSTLQQVPLRDLRTMKEKPNLETDGFTYASNRHVGGREFGEYSYEHLAALDEDAVELVKKLTGATSAHSYAPFFRDHEFKFSPRPITTIHSDMSPEGAKFTKTLVQESFSMSDDPKKVEFANYMKLGGKNIVILNAWRPIRTVRDNHLGICKWGSLLNEDKPYWNIKPTDTENALQAWRYRKGQEWFFLSNQKSDEVYVFMQHDSRAPDGHGINVPHASFNFQSDHTPPERTSFETAVIAIVE